MEHGSLNVDVVVVGLGAIGSSVVYQLAKRGVRVLGLDRYPVPHAFGSSHGETRITRQAVGEGAAYIPLVRNSHRIWREIEADTGQELLRATGNLIISPGSIQTSHHGKLDFVRQSAALALAHGIPHELLDGVAIRARYPHFVGVSNDDIGYYEPEAGYLHPERCITAQLELACRHGALIEARVEIRSVYQDSHLAVAVTASGETISADHIVVASGPWTGPLLGGEIEARLRVYRQVLHWFDMSEDVSIGEDAPTFIWMHGSQEVDYFYGFPPFGGQRCIKVATEQYERSTTADETTRTVAPLEAETMFRTHVAGRISGIKPRATRSTACLYTVTPDRGFIIDRHPQHDRVYVISACSGHGFKHAAGIGEAIAERIFHGQSEVDLSPFRLSRFHDANPQSSAA